MGSKEYLRSISKKIEFYYNTRKRIITYILTEEIKDIPLQVSLLVTGAVWAATKLDDELTEDTLLSVFGLESVPGTNETTTFKLQHAHQELSLIEVLDIAVENH